MWRTRRLLSTFGLLIAVVGVLITVVSNTTSAANPPDPPTLVSARAGSGDAVIRWVAPVATGGLLVTEYTATASPGGGSCSVAGTPAGTSCTVTGLTNGTAYTFTVTATTSGGTSLASVASSAVTPLAGTTGVNFLAEDGTRVFWNESTVGATSPRSGSLWPFYVYNNSLYPVHDVYITAADVNDPLAALSCFTQSWAFPEILCDPPTSTGAQTADSPEFVYKPSTAAGFTIDSDASTEAYVVVDLLAMTDFTTLRVFQMFSDGKVTQASISSHPSSAGAMPAFDDAGWTELGRQAVSSGLLSSLDGNTVVACPTTLDVGAHRSRYVKLTFKNSGEFGNPTWIEVGAAKLFFESAPPVLGSGCPPEPPTDATASPGNGSASVSWTPGSANATSWSLQYRRTSGGSWTSASTDPASVSGAATSAVVIGLTNGLEYEFRVLASNAVASSPYSLPSNAVTPNDVLPPTPADAAAEPGIASATIVWTEVSGATGYSVVGDPSGSCTAAVATCVVTGLTPGLPYTFRVYALNDFGQSGASAATVAVVPLAAATTTSAPASTTTVALVSTTAVTTTTTRVPTTTVAPATTVTETTPTSIANVGGLPITGGSTAMVWWASAATALGVGLWWATRRRGRDASL